MSRQGDVDARAESLYRAAGVDSGGVPNMLELAEKLLGPDTISFVGAKRRSHARRAVIAVIAAVGDHFHLYLQRGVSDAENQFALARGIAEWECGRGGDAEGEDSREQLALSIALPRETMDWYHRAGLTPGQIAHAMHVPCKRVRERERAFTKLRLVPPLRPGVVRSARTPPRSPGIVVGGHVIPRDLAATYLVLSG